MEDREGTVWEHAQQDAPDGWSQAGGVPEAEPEETARTPPEGGASQGEGEPQEGEPQGEEARRAAYQAGLWALHDGGWTPQELQAFSVDGQVHKDLAGGMSLERAAEAYLRRDAAQQAGRPAAKRAVPTTRNTAAGTAPAQSRIEQMSDREFDAFSRRIKGAMMEGKQINL